MGSERAFRHRSYRNVRAKRELLNILQLRLLKVAVKVEEMATKIKFHFPSSFPLQSLYVKIMANLSGAAP